MKYITTAFMALLFCADAIAWQGVNLDTGTLIEIQSVGMAAYSEGNIEYFDHEVGEIKLGYLNMYEQNIGLILDLDTGDLLRVRMTPIEADSK